MQGRLLLYSFGCQLLKTGHTAVLGEMDAVLTLKSVYKEAI